MLASVMPGVVSANFWRDLTFFTCIPAAVTAVTLPLFTSANTSTFFPVVWILCLPFFLMFSPSRSFPLRWCFSFANAMRDASIVVAAAIIPSTRRRLIMNLFPLESGSAPTTFVRISCKRCDQVSFVICTEPMMNGPTTDKSQSFPIRCESRGHLQSPCHRSRRVRSHALDFLQEQSSHVSPPDD